MSKSIGIIGGDLRICMLAGLLASDWYRVYTYGLEKMKIEEGLSKHIIFCKEVGELAKEVDIIISSIPLEREEKVVYTPYSDEVVRIDKVFEAIQGKTIIAGAIEEYVYEIAKRSDVHTIDILKKEELSVLNSIPTAEGAIQVAISESDITLHNSNCLILGFGRIGKILAHMLHGIGAKVYCEARREEDLAWIEAYGYNKIVLDNLGESLGNYDYIFNTIPYIILDEQKLSNLKEKCLIIELASKPYGVDIKAAEKKGIKVIIASGLPGKVAPLTSARYLKSIIYKTIENM